MKEVAFLGLGSNLGDRFANLLAGAAAVDACHDIVVRRMATILETEPMGVEGHQPYLNTVLEIETTCTPEQVMEACLSVELGLGRRRADDGTCNPRQLDVDILLFGEQVLDAPSVQVPHPRMHERAFVLVPMVELAPDMMHPVLGSSMEELLQAEIELHGPVTDRCAILSPGSLLDDGPMSGPAGLPAS